MDKDYLIEEAKRRYPIGTTYIPLRTDGIDYDSPYTIIKREPGYLESDDAVYISTKGFGFGCVYVKGKWATIVKPTETIEAIDPTENITLKKVTHVRCTREVTTFKLGEIYEVDKNGKPIGENNWTSPLNWDDPKRINNDSYATFEIYNPSTESQEPQPQEEFPLTVKDLVPGKWYMTNYWTENSCARFVRLDKDNDFVYDRKYYDGEYEVENESWLISENSKFKEITDLSFIPKPIEPMVENTSDLKQGDWVIGWHAICGDWRDKPWQVKEVFKNPDNVDSVRPLFHTDANYATYLKNVKKLSQQEVLEWVDKEYPEGCKYMDADVNPYKSPKVREWVPKFFRSDKIDIGYGYIYYEGKWAEKVDYATISLIESGVVSDTEKLSVNTTVSTLKKVEDVKVETPTKSEDTSTISALEHPKLGDIMVHKINNIIGRLAVSHGSNPFCLKSARFNFGAYDHFYGICIGELSEFRDATSTEVALYLEAGKNNFPSASRGLRPTIQIADEAAALYHARGIDEAWKKVNLLSVEDSYKLKAPKKKSSNTIIDRYVKENPEDLLG
jgi:hypothetical protein